MGGKGGVDYHTILVPFLLMVRWFTLFLLLSVPSSSALWHHSQHRPVRTAQVDVSHSGPVLCGLRPGSQGLWEKI